MDLFALGDLPSWLQIPEIDTETEIRCRRAASGWLKDATGLADWPDPVPDQLWAWGVELAAIAFRNPDGTLTETSETRSRSRDRERRAEILAAARQAYGGGSGSREPSYAFPEPDWHWTAVPNVTQE